MRDAVPERFLVARFKTELSLLPALASRHELIAGATGALLIDHMDLRAMEFDGDGKCVAGC